MKKTIIALTLLALAGAASADSISVSGAVAESAATGVDSNRFTFGYKKDLAKGFAGDVSVSNTSNTSTNALSNRTEAGLTASVLEAGRLTGSVRVATGAKMVSGSDTKYYYSVEPGVSYKLTDSLSARVAYRFRDAYANDVADRSNTNRVSLSYALSKSNTVSVGYDKVRGDGAEKAVSVGLSHAF